MRIGIISEGPADIAVITNIIKGITGLDSNDIVPIRPKLKYDNTHLAHLDPESFSSWSLVKQECVDRKRIDEFLALEDSTHVVIHIDTAEKELYGVTGPPKHYHNYCVELRILIIDKIKEWLDYHFLNTILYAIAIEETDAWVLTLFDKRESCNVPNPKKLLQYRLGKKGVSSESTYSNYLNLTKPLSKVRQVKQGHFLDFNCSLREFYQDVLGVWKQCCLDNNL